MLGRQPGERETVTAINSLASPDEATNRPRLRTALVLSAGAMFGAYQAGVWKALEGRISIDVVIGASVGCLNGWAIAAGMPAASLADRWLTLEEASRFRLRWPRRLLDGFAQADYLRAWIQELHSGLQPTCEYGVVLTRVWPFRPLLVKHPQVTWQHLAASCAMPLVFPHYRLDGHLFTDGGLMQALPLWAVEEFECERVIAVNVLPTVPFPGGAVAKRVMRSLSDYPQPPTCAELLSIQPKRPLGGVRDFLLWKRENAERWLRQGHDDALHRLGLAGGDTARHMVVKPMDARGA